MGTLKYIFSFICCLLLVFVQAQLRNFEFNNPDAIILDDKNLEVLTSGYWRVFKNDVESRGNIISTTKNISMCYYPDGTFFYNGSTGTWWIQEDKYIVHELDKETKDDLNFGGIFSVLELSNSTLTLTKLLTSSHDMKRTLFLKSSSVLTRNGQPNSGGPYRYEGSLDEVTLDSISKMDSDELFDAGFTILQNNMIHIMTPDTLYVIRRDAKKERYERIPIR